MLCDYLCNLTAPEPVFLFIVLTAVVGVGLVLDVSGVPVDGGGHAQTPVVITNFPYVGVTLMARSDTAPRPLKINVVDIDLSAPGLRFQLTSHAGRLDTVCMSTLAFLNERKAQMAINAHFFEPWPMTNSDQAANLVGIAASDGQVYSPFEDNPPSAFAIHPNAPGLNLDARNHATIVHRGSNAFSTAEPVRLWNTVSGNEHIVSNGVNIAARSVWNTNANPRTAIAIAPGNHLLLVTVDGRQTNVSEGVTVPELADLLIRDYRVEHALLLDGGGSTTLVMDAPTPHIVNVPAAQPPRAVGSSLAIFALPATVVTNPTSRTRVRNEWH